MYEFEAQAGKEGFSIICGTDEAGRGPLAGPVVAGAVILDPNNPIEGLNDSKKLSEKKREQLFLEIQKKALSWSYSIVDPITIDAINIYEASRLAMRQAIAKLRIKPDFILSDAMPLPGETPYLAIIKGDARSASIAAASIVAKVTRDHLMMEYGKKYPEYGFESHKGYPTEKHVLALKQHGITPIHRLSFEPVKSMVQTQLKWDL